MPADNAAQTWAFTLAQRPTLALGLTKRALHAALTSSLKEAIYLEADLQARCFDSEDHAEGLKAFLEKREPHFTGT